MKKNYQRICLIFSAAAILVFCGSCTPDDDNTVKAEAAGNKVRVGKEGAFEENAEENIFEELSMLSEISEPEGKDFLLYSESLNDAVYPDDFAIGPMQQLIEPDETELSISLLVKDFTESIFDDELKDDLIYSKRRSFVVRRLNDASELKESSAYRLGIINFDSEPASAEIRFIGNNQYSHGTVYFIREGSWKIYDLQMEASEHGLNEKLSDGKWFPVYNKVQ